MSKGRGNENYRQTSIEYWRDIISRYEGSGKSRKQFCLENGISLSAFKNWIYRIRSTQQKPAALHPPLFTQIVVAEEAPSLTPAPPESPLILEISDIRIVISTGFSSETLRRLLDVVRG